MATGYVNSIFKAQCGIPMTSLKLTSTSFEYIAEFSFPRIFYFLSINLDKNMPNQISAKYLRPNTILITKYLTLHWNIVKSYTFTEKLTDFI